MEATAAAGLGDDLAPGEHSDSLDDSGRPFCKGRAGTQTALTAKAVAFSWHIMVEPIAPVDDGSSTLDGRCNHALQHLSFSGCQTL